MIRTYSTININAFNNGVIEYDLCGNAYQYKMDWANGVRQHITFEIFGFNVGSKMLYSLEYKIIPLLRKLKINKLKEALKYK